MRSREPFGCGTDLESAFVGRHHAFDPADRRWTAAVVGLVAVLALAAGFWFTRDGDAPPAPPQVAAPSSDPAPRAVAAPGPRSWIAVLESVSVSTGVEDAETRRAGLQSRYGRSVNVLVSDAYASLRPGYRVLYGGPFSTGRDATDFCRQLGRSERASCVGRYLSQDPAHRTLVCAVDSGPDSPSCREH